MLFLFGTRNAAIATAPLPGLACANCHTPDALTCTVVSRYLHLFWIPVFPIGKASLTVCQHCKQALTVGEMPASYRGPVQAVQQQARTPLTHFALLLLFGAVVAFGLVMSLSGKSTTRPAAATNTAASTVAVGSRYRFNVTDDGRQYSLIEVTRVTPDSVQYRMTNPLRGNLTTASATLALRDSVVPANSHQQVSTQQWEQSSTGQGLFKQLD